VVGGLALAVGFAVVTMLEAAEALPRDIPLAFRSAQRSTAAGDLIVHCSFVPTDVTRGVQLGLLGFLFGGVPAAIFGAVLSARRHTRENGWSGDWEKVFRAGFVFQLTSLALTAFLLVLLLGAAYDSAAPAKDVVPFVGPLLLSVLCGAWGLRSWRGLQLGVRQTMPTISVQERAG
jgi:hypothetical protein